MIARGSWSASLVIGLGVVACGGDGGPAALDASPPDGAIDAAIDAIEIDAVDNGMPSDTYPAFTIDAPRALSLGGPVLATPHAVPIYFANDDAAFTAQLATFLHNLAASTFWP